MSDEQTPGADGGAPPEPLAGSGAAPADPVVNRVTGEIVPTEGMELARVSDLTPEAVRAYLEDMDAQPDDGAETVQVDIARRILEATSVDDLWKATEVITADAVLNQPLEVESVRWATSRHAAGLPKFAVIEGSKVYGGERFVMTCGATNVVLTLYKLEQFKALPAKVLLEKKPTGTEGRSIITIKPVV